MLPYDEFNDYCEHIEEKRKKINKRAVEEYEKEGTLSGSVLLEESKELDVLLNKELFKGRMVALQDKEKEQTDTGEE